MLLELRGSGESAEEAQFREKAQGWLIRNVDLADPWRPEDWKARYGEYEEF
ncbi:MAG TPA: hypothetical protein VLV83_11345 [Acidobacteriota bacterium]|nr:hypothetical protein [Acidobacteriota bacterium]